MYEPIRTKSVHRMQADAQADYPHRSREEELDIQLAGHLSALLAVTDELGLDEAAERIAEQVARLRGAPPARNSRPQRRRQPASSTAAPTTSLAAPSSSRHPAPTPPPRSSRPSGWTCTPPPSHRQAPTDGPGPRAEEAHGPGATHVIRSPRPPPPPR